MKNNSKKDGKSVLIIVVLVLLYLISNCSREANYNDKDYTRKKVRSSNTFRIISSTSTKKMDNDIISYAKKNGFKVEIEHYGDLEIVDKLNSDSKDYDAVWISNSIWLYMLDNSNLITDSKSIVINPVVMGINKSKAKELGFIDKEIYNKDILEMVKSNKLKLLFIILVSASLTQVKLNTIILWKNHVYVIMPIKQFCP